MNPETRPVQDRPCSDPDTEERFRDEGKIEINHLLWRLLPAWTTLGEAEDIACKMFDMIKDEWDRPTREASRL